ncbi:hypothetical protein Mapa_008759 [Marchantia paleacea]|nr:hypothetical protein Mapa_008759 [Marchantia paleacea]
MLLYSYRHRNPRSFIQILVVGSSSSYCKSSAILQSPRGDRKKGESMRNQCLPAFTPKRSTSRQILSFMS